MKKVLLTKKMRENQIRTSLKLIDTVLMPMNATKLIELHCAFIQEHVSKIRSGIEEYIETYDSDEGKAEFFHYMSYHADKINCKISSAYFEKKGNYYLNKHKNNSYG